MFFPRLRRQAKWAFALMVLVFGVGFVFLGVGSGGLDLGAMLRGCASQNSTGRSIEKAQKKVDEDPRDPAAQKALAQAYDQKGRTDEAIATYQQYLALKPKDAEVLQRVGELQSTEADTSLQEAQAAFLRQSLATAGSTFGPSPSSKFGRALGPDPISSALQTKTSTAAQEASTKYQTQAQAAVATYKKLARVQPTQDNVFALAQKAQHFGDTSTAIKAYKDLLKQTDDPATREQIQAQIKALQQAAGAGSGG
jgi:Flp pilus assembly protein TadD